VVDGLPETTPDGQGQVDNLDLGSIEQIEVLRGAAAGLYGHAAGGVIRMRTDSIRAGRHATAQNTFGSFGQQQYRLAVGEGRGAWGWRMSGVHQRLVGYREHAAMRNTILNGKISFKKHISLIINYSDSPLADDAGALTLAEAEANRRMARTQNTQLGAGETVRQGKIGATGTHAIDTRRGVQWHAFGVGRQFANRLPVANSGAVSFDRAWAGAGVAYTQRHLFFKKNAQLRVHTAYEIQRDDRQRRDNSPSGPTETRRLDQRETYANAALGAEWQYTPDEQIQVTAALRYDRLWLQADDRLLDDGDQSGRRVFDNLNPMLGIGWAIWGGMWLYANAATAFETPSLTELARPDGLGGFNPALAAQRSRSIECGAKGFFLKKKIRYDVAMYRIVATDEIVPYEVAGVAGAFFRNAGATRRVGVEGMVEVPIGRWLQASVTWQQASFEYQKAADSANDGKKLPGLPAQQGVVMLRGGAADAAPKGWYGAAQAQYAGRVWADDANATSVDPVWIGSVRGGYGSTWRGIRWSCFGGISNLTDTPFFSNLRINAAGGRYYEPGAGRGWYVGVSVGG
jgi:iron complex outermembrane recepter protein